MSENRQYGLQAAHQAGSRAHVERVMDGAALGLMAAMTEITREWLVADLREMAAHVEVDGRLSTLSYHTQTWRELRVLRAVIAGGYVKGFTVFDDPGERVLYASLLADVIEDNAL